MSGENEQFCVNTQTGLLGLISKKCQIELLLFPNKSFVLYTDLSLILDIHLFLPKKNSTST